MYTVHNQAIVYPAVHMNSSLKNRQSGEFLSASNVLPIRVVRKKKRKGIFFASPCVSTASVFSPHFALDRWNGTVLCLVMS